MAFYIAKTLTMAFDKALEKTRDELAKEELEIAFEIDAKATLKERLDVSFRRYRILGVVNPSLFHRAVLMDDRSGLMIPCNVIVQERSETVTEIAAIDPRETMRLMGNPGLEDVSKQIGAKLENVIARI